jgi:hypothetical protein
LHHCHSTSPSSASLVVIVPAETPMPPYHQETARTVMGGHAILSSPTHFSVSLTPKYRSRSRSVNPPAESRKLRRNELCSLLAVVSLYTCRVYQKQPTPLRFVRCQSQ